MRLGVVLVHGFLGRPSDLGPLHEALAREVGADAVVSVELAATPSGATARFDFEVFVRATIDAVDRLARGGLEVVLVGHSTGGTIALGARDALPRPPRLVVLAGVPKRVGERELESWRAASASVSRLEFVDLARVATAVNRVGRRSGRQGPVLLLQGRGDALVAEAEAVRWRDEAFGAEARLVLLGEVGHDLFAGEAGRRAVGVVVRAVADLAMESDAPPDASARLSRVDPLLGAFLSLNPAALPHVVRAPAGRRALGLLAGFGRHVAHDPLRLHVEVTTRCTLACAHCARSRLKRPACDLPPARLEELLGLLPHAAHVVFAGLGEPTLHPELPALVGLAARQQRRTTVVSNGTGLDDALVDALWHAGLHTLVVSVDAVSQELADSVRSGTDVARLLETLRRLVARRPPTRPPAIVAFTAVSARTIERLPALVERLADAGVDAQILSDLNFPFNRAKALGAGAEGRTALRQALSRSFARGLPVLSVRHLEALDLESPGPGTLVRSFDDVARRSPLHSFCASPWQTLAVAADGEVTACDCQPELRAGNVFESPLSDIWNGDVLGELRERMRSATPPDTCLACPRF